MFLNINDNILSWYCNFHLESVFRYITSPESSQPPTCRQNGIYLHSIDQEIPHQRWQLSSKISKLIFIVHGPDKTRCSTFSCSGLIPCYSKCGPRQAARHHGRGWGGGVGRVSHARCSIKDHGASVEITLSLNLEPQIFLTYAAFLIHKGFRFQHPLSFSFVFST